MCLSQLLEKALGGRTRVVKVPKGDDVEEVNMVEYDRDHAGATHHSDSDDERGHGPHVQCANQ